MTLGIEEEFDKPLKTTLKNDTINAAWRKRRLLAAGVRPDISRADFTFCLLSIDWGWTVEQTAAV